MIPFVVFVPSRDFVTAFGHPIHVAPDCVFIRPLIWKAIVFSIDGSSLEATGAGGSARELVESRVVAIENANSFRIEWIIRLVPVC